MPAESIRQSPGVYFQREPRPDLTALPRMDVAAFVGFAAKGPLNLPVAVEDIAWFREIFGPDLPLAWDADRKRTQYSQLGAAVEMFFRNGGSRCWVVRVAQAEGENAIVLQEFRVPGLFVASAALPPARIGARCPGGWASSLSVRSRLRGTQLPIREFSAPASAAGYYALELASVPHAIEVGELIELRWTDIGLRAFLFVDTLSAELDCLSVRAKQVYWFEECGDCTSPHIETTGGLLPLSETEGLDQLSHLGSPSVLPHGRVQRFELQAWEGDRLTGVMGDLGFDYRHPRFWGGLADDAKLFGTILAQWQADSSLQLSDLDAQSLHPRFALAGIEMQGQRTLPLGMADDAEAGMAIGHVVGAAAEGLASFSASLFLDPDLATTTVATLTSEAKHKLEVLGQNLRGIHSLWNLHEVSMIAVPDAAHRQWDRSPRPGRAVLSAPWLEEISMADDRGRRELRWSAVYGVRGYLVQASATPGFEHFEQWHIDRPSRLELLSGDADDNEPATTLRLTLDDGCPQEYYFRVRAIGYKSSSAWSNTLGLRIPERAFHACRYAAVEALGLVLEVAPVSAPGVRRLHWVAESPTGLDSRIDGYELQSATDAVFTAPSLIYSGDQTQHDVLLEARGRCYFRVRATASGKQGPWSNTIILDPEALRVETLRSEETYDADDMLAVQRALVRLCASRADTVALLGLPAHYREPELNRHLIALGTNLASGSSGIVDGSQPSPGLVTALRPGERAALDYASLYYPWLRRGEPQPYRQDLPGISPTQVTPEGAVAGLLASRAQLAGAWISAANQPLIDVLGLSPYLDEAMIASLSMRGVNMVQRGARGFLLARTDTLSANNELRPLSVRRLLTLLRRLIDREGNRYVFEPNSFDFREAVHDQWESLLHELYERGALRGTASEAAYRVVTDLSVNDDQASEGGRFTVELHIAPSQPLRFLNVRLVQSGPEQLLVQEL